VQGQIGIVTAANTVAVAGLNNATGAGGVAVQAIIGAGSAPGTVAINAQNRSAAANSHALTAVATAGHGLVGSSLGGNTYAGLVGNAGPNGARAGAFYGDVVFSANFFVLGNQTVYGAKSAALPHADGSYRLVYCVESPESWLEDFGEGTLANGTADVKIAADFAAVADTSEMHVFITETGGTHYHLSTDKIGPVGFTVTADTKGAALKGLKDSDLTATFSYRVVAKRKDVKADRLAKVEKPTLAPIKLPAPIVSPPVGPSDTHPTR
jgi:hypothetical protein